MFAGNVFLTEVGARFDEARQLTEITARNIAPTAEAAGKVELSVWSVDGADNKRKDRVFTSEQKGAPGATAWTWDGRGSDGKPRPRGRYVAELVMRDARGKTIQKESTLFFHDSEAEQKKQFAEIEGNLAMRGGAGISANTTVELVDEGRHAWCRRCGRPRRATTASRASPAAATACAPQGRLGARRRPRSKPRRL